MDFAVPLQQPYTFYVAAATGGIWKTVRTMISWSNRSANNLHTSTMWDVLSCSNVLRARLTPYFLFKNMAHSGVAQVTMAVITVSHGRIFIEGAVRWLIEIHNN